VVTTNPSQLAPVSPDADPFLRSDFPEPWMPPSDVLTGGSHVDSPCGPVPVEPVAENAQWRSAWVWTRRRW
jgi:hypothetical protein